MASAPGAGSDESYTAVYFEITGTSSLGRITFEGLDAVKAARGTSLPYGTAVPRTADDWVFTVGKSPWLAERHQYEMQRYSTPLLETCQHYVFQFHDEFVEAIAEGIWLPPAHPGRSARLPSIRCSNCLPVFQTRGSCHHRPSNGNCGVLPAPTAN